MLLQIILLLIAIPVGYLIAYLTPEELKDGQMYFKAIIILSIIVGIWFFSTDQSYISWTVGFIAIASFVSIIKAK